MMQAEGFLSNRGHTFGHEEANEPPPTLSRLPPDGHEFPPDYRDPAASTIFQVNKTETLSNYLFVYSILRSGINWITNFITITIL